MPTYNHTTPTTINDAISQISSMADSNLKQALVLVIEKATSGVETAAEFVSDQLPLVVMELLWWHGIKSFGIFVLIVCAAAMILYYLVKGYKRKVDDFTLYANKASEWYTSEGDDRLHYESDVDSRFKRHYPHVPIYRKAHVTDHKIMAIIGGIILTIVCIFSLSFEWLQILVAPRLYLIEYAAQLISSMKK